MRRSPWWLALAPGVGALALAAYLIADPFRTVSVLAGVVAAGLLLCGLGELAGARASAHPGLARLTAALWLAAGVLAAVWPGITIGALAIAIGVALLLSGGARLLAARRESSTQERRLLLVQGLANALVGLLALAWPGITVLALAVGVGVVLALAGVSLLAAALAGKALAGHLARARERLRWRGDAGQGERAWRWAATLCVLTLALVGVGVSVALHTTSSPAPGPFYAAPSPLPKGPPGTIIREEAIPNLFPGADAYRILYKSTGLGGRPTAVSGVVFVPEGAAPRGGRRIVAFAHGTVGVATRCAPSLRRGFLPQVIEGLGVFIAEGYVVTATDYQGLGTPGPHPYLVGRVEGMNVLDSVRAAHHLRDAHAGVRFAIWGHSQGGQAALFAAQLAPGYAPRLRLVGVAAGAPVPNLVDLFKANLSTPVGKILISMALRSWEQVYPDAGLDQVVTLAGRGAVERIARYCLYGSEYLAAVPSALVLGLSFISTPPWGVQPWKSILAQNTPGNAPIGVPILITQGDADKIVPPRDTVALVRALCARGEQVQLRLYPSVEHAEAGIVAAPDVAAWIGERFAGVPPPSTCPAAAGRA